MPCRAETFVNFTSRFEFKCANVERLHALRSPPHNNLSRNVNIKTSPYSGPAATSAGERGCTKFIPFCTFADVVGVQTVGETK